MLVPVNRGFKNDFIGFTRVYENGQIECLVVPPRVLKSLIKFLL